MVHSAYVKEVAYIMIKKLTSRKFIVAVVSIVSGILGMFNFSDSVISCAGSILMILLPSVAYVITEGSIDRANVVNVLKEVADKLEKYN